MLRPSLLACSLLLLGFLPACGPSDPATTTSRQVLTLLTWEGYFPKSVLEDFSEIYDAEIELLYFETADELRGKLVSHPERYDVLVMDDTTLQRLKQDRLLAELNHEALPHLVNLGHYADQPFDPDNRYSVPYQWGTTLIAYNTKLVNRPLTSWSDLWDPEVIGSGTVAMLKEPMEVFGAALLINGHSLNSREPASIEEARDTLLNQFDRVNVAYLDTLDIQAALEQGACVAAMHYSGDAGAAAENNPDIALVIPEEGAAIWMDNFAISRESDQLTLSHAFLDFMMRAEVAKACSEYCWYGSPNEAAEKILDPALLNDPAIYPPPEVLHRCDYHDASEERHRLFSLHMREIKERFKRLGSELASSSPPPQQ